MPYQVLIADDEVRICSGLKTLVPWAAHGFEVIGTCSSGAEVLEQLQQRVVDLLVTDIYMDGLTGIDLIRMIAQNRWKTKVLLISGYQNVELAMAALRYNAMGYVLKPIHIPDFLEALDKTRAQLDLENGVTDQTQRDSPGIIEQIQAYLCDHLREDLSLDCVGDHFHISSTHLSRLFKQETGENFLDFLTHKRMERAMLLLRQPAMTISAVGTLVGYNSARYFSEVFKRYAGMTPREYRQGNALPEVTRQEGMQDENS